MSITFEQHVYTERELIERVWDIEEIMDLMNRRVYYMVQGLRREELNDLWVRESDHRKTASFGRNYGYYLGMDEIIRYSPSEIICNDKKHVRSLRTHALRAGNCRRNRRQCQQCTNFNITNHKYYE